MTNWVIVCLKRPRLPKWRKRSVRFSKRYLQWFLQLLVICFDFKSTVVKSYTNNLELINSVVLSFLATFIYKVEAQNLVDSSRAHSKSDRLLMWQAIAARAKESPLKIPAGTLVLRHCSDGLICSVLFWAFCLFSIHCNDVLYFISVFRFMFYKSFFITANLFLFGFSRWASVIFLR